MLSITGPQDYRSALSAVYAALPPTHERAEAAALALDIPFQLASPHCAVPPRPGRSHGGHTSRGARSRGRQSAFFTGTRPLSQPWMLADFTRALAWAIASARRVNVGSSGGSKLRAMKTGGGLPGALRRTGHLPSSIAVIARKT